MAFCVKPRCSASGWNFFGGSIHIPYSRNSLDALSIFRAQFVAQSPYMAVESRGIDEVGRGASQTIP